jgi:hypothetical protein
MDRIYTGRAPSPETGESTTSTAWWLVGQQSARARLRKPAQEKTHAAVVPDVMRVSSMRVTHTFYSTPDNSTSPAHTAKRSARLRPAHHGSYSLFQKLQEALRRY